MRAAAIVLALACIAAPGCSAGEPDRGAIAADSITQRQRDSVVGASGLPGSGGVRRALDASDAAAARAAAHDSLSGGR